MSDSRIRTNKRYKSKQWFIADTTELNAIMKSLFQMGQNNQETAGNPSPIIKPDGTAENTIAFRM